jgi:hypothetical protein
MKHTCSHCKLRLGAAVALYILSHIAPACTSGGMTHDWQPS